MNHKTALIWLLVAAAATAILMFSALSIQQPDMIKKTPFFRPTPTTAPAASQNIVLLSPRMNEHITQKLIIEGQARVFENRVAIRIKNKLTGKVYGQTFTQTNAQESGEFGDFRAGVLLDNDDLKPGTELVLEVFQVSPKDGSDTDKVSVTLIFSPTAE